MSKSQEVLDAEAELGRLEDEISLVRHQIAAAKGLIAQREREIARAEYERSPEYENELRAKLLTMDHRDAFNEVAKTAGFANVKARDACWKRMLEDGLYKVVGPPAAAAIEHAVEQFRKTEDYYFEAGRATPERWSPSGPINFTSNGANANGSN